MEPTTYATDAVSGPPEIAFPKDLFEMNFASFPSPNSTSNPNPPIIVVDAKGLAAAQNELTIPEEETVTTQSPIMTRRLRERKRQDPPALHDNSTMDPSSSDTSVHHHDDEQLHSPPSSPTRKRRKRPTHRMPWEERLQQLKDYKATYGDLLIPIRFKENPSLGKFVHNTREQYKLYQKPPIDGKAKRCSLTAERVEQLESLGFVWSTERTKHQKEDWEARLQQLRDYKARHGDCLVPHGYSEDAAFAEWVHRQRTTYAHMLKEEERHHHHNPLVVQRMKQLVELGFHFTVHKDKWYEHWRDLKEYRDIHGHCQVPTHCPSNPKLGRWVHTQRHQRRLQLKGKKSCMTHERVQLLDSLGFSWEVRPQQHRAESLEDQHVDPLPVNLSDHDEMHGENIGFGDLLNSVHSEDLHPEGHGVIDASGNESVAVPAPDLECTFQSHQDGSQDLFVHGMTMV